MITATENIILKKTIEFPLLIIEYCELLQTQKKFVFAQQLLKSGTSISANVHEAQNAKSKIDFIHKFKIAAKEVEETKYLLILCSNFKTYFSCKHLVNALHEIEEVITKIISTSKLLNCRIGKLSNCRIWSTIQ